MPATVHSVRRSSFKGFWRCELMPYQDTLPASRPTWRTTWAGAGPGRLMCRAASGTRTWWCPQCVRTGEPGSGSTPAKILEIMSAFVPARVSVSRLSQQSPLAAARTRVALVDRPARTLQLLSGKAGGALGHAIGVAKLAKWGAAIVHDEVSVHGRLERRHARPRGHVPAGGARLRPCCGPTLRWHRRPPELLAHHRQVREGGRRLTHAEQGVAQVCARVGGSDGAGTCMRAAAHQCSETCQVCEYGLPQHGGQGPRGRLLLQRKGVWGV